MKNKQNIIILSGGFDPVHKGHIRMFKAAKAFTHMADEAIVVVGLNSDEWLCRKKGRAFMEFEERKEILQSIKYIDQVYSFDDSDETACDLIRKVSQLYVNDDPANKPNIIFGNGGDRTNETTPEMEYCQERNVSMMWDVGGGKVQSSSTLISDAKFYGNID